MSFRGLAPMLALPLALVTLGLAAEARADSPTLLGVESSGFLYDIDPFIDEASETNAATFRAILDRADPADIRPFSIQGLTYNPFTDALWGYDAAQKQTVIIDPDTGDIFTAATVTDALGLLPGIGTISNLTVGPDPTLLYAVNVVFDPLADNSGNGANVNYLLQIDQASGIIVAASLINDPEGNLDAANVGGLAWDDAFNLFFGFSEGGANGVTFVVDLGGTAGVVEGSGGEQLSATLFDSTIYSTEFVPGGGVFNELQERTDTFGAPFLQPVGLGDLFLGSRGLVITGLANPNAIPEPTSLILLGLGVIGVAARRRRGEGIRGLPD